MVRRNANTPFEVMGKATAAEGEEPKTASVSEPRAASVDRGVEAVAPGEPLVLRVPKGLAIGVVVGLILVVGLAYWVGYQRGAGSVEAEEGGIVDRPPGPIGQALVPEPELFVGSSLDGVGVEVLDLNRTPMGWHEAGSGADPRSAGLNYLILATYPEAEALRLAVFLADRGVASVLEPVNNARFQVVAVNVGFTRNAFERGVHEIYRRSMLEIGRAWHAENGGRGSDALQDMYFYRHGPTP
ncbi:hypothetical protein [Mucisphaera sp.]|uniref:hypothetical protein n=1 Tax=Mucisphaera sp. TaxID=2913024 RepID=UPI003D10C688